MGSIVITTPICAYLLQSEPSKSNGSAHHHQDSAEEEPASDANDTRAQDHETGSEASDASNLSDEESNEEAAEETPDSTPGASEAGDEQTKESASALEESTGNMTSGGDATASQPGDVGPEPRAEEMAAVKGPNQHSNQSGPTDESERDDPMSSNVPRVKEPSKNEKGYDHREGAPSEDTPSEPLYRLEDKVGRAPDGEILAR